MFGGRDRDPQGVSYTFSPLKSEFAFDKLVLNNFVASYKIYEFVANIAVSIHLPALALIFCMISGGSNIIEITLEDTRNSYYYSVV